MNDMLPTITRIHAIDHEALRAWHRLTRAGWVLPMDADLSEDLARMSCGSWLYSPWRAN